MSSGAKAVLFCCLAMLAVGLIYRASSGLEPALPGDMPAGSRFISTGYDLEKNERRGSWVYCSSSAADRDNFCRVTNVSGAVIYQGDFSGVRTERTSKVPGTIVLAKSGLGWVSGPVEGSPVPVIPLSDGSVLVPRDDRDALLHRWMANPEEWQRLVAAHR